MKILHVLRKTKVVKRSETSNKQTFELGEHAFLLLFSQVSIKTCMKMFNCLLPCSSLSFHFKKDYRKHSNGSLKHLSSYLVLSQRL